MHKQLRKAIATLLMALTSVALGGEPLTTKDRESLTKLYGAFDGDFNIGKVTNYPKYFDTKSLAKLMTEHREWLDRMRRRLTDAELAKQYTFTPDLPSVLLERDPAKYFTSLGTGKENGNLREIGICFRVLGIAGDREKAFLVVGEFMAGPPDSEAVSYSVWPALIENGEWRLDASKLVRDLRLLEQPMPEQGGAPSQPAKAPEPAPDGKKPEGQRMLIDGL